MGSRTEESGVSLCAAVGVSPEVRNYVADDSRGTRSELRMVLRPPDEAVFPMVRRGRALAGWGATV